MGKTKRPETREVAELKARLAEAEEALRAIRSGEVDALVVSTSQGDKVFTIVGGDTPYRLLVEAMNEGALLLLPDGTILFGNKHFAALAKTPLEQISGASWERFFPPEEQLQLTALLKAAHPEGNRGEFSLLAGDGSRRPVQLSLRVMKGEDGAEAITVVVTDLTERKAYERSLHQAKAELEVRVQERTEELATYNEELHAEIAERGRTEEALRESEAKYRSLFENSMDAIFLTIPNGKIVAANQASCVLFRMTAEEICRTRRDGLLDPTDPNFLTALDERKRTGKIKCELNFLRKDGTKFPAEVNSVILDNGSKAFVILRDLTERKRAEAAVAAVHRQVQSIIDNTTAIVYAFDLEERFLLANTALAELLNSAPELMIGKRRHEFMPKDDADWHEANDRQVMEAGRALEFEEHSQLKGRSITWLTTKFPLRDAQGRIYAVAGISADVSERKRAEEQLRAAKDELAHANEDLERTLNSITDGYYALDSGWRFVSVNARTEEHFGRPASALLGQSIWELTATPVDSVFYQRFTEARATGQPMHFEAQSQVRPNFWAHLHLYPRDGVLEVYYADISERKRAEETLRRVSERDAFLVALADALRPLSDADEIKSTAARVLGQHLRASRVAYAEVTPEGDVIIERGYADGVADIPGRYRLDDYGPALLPEIRAGRNIVVADVANVPGYTEQEKARYRAVQVVGNLNVPLLKNGHPVALLAVHQVVARQWTDEDVLLVKETVERTWATVERARAEEALRQSEERFRIVQELSPDGFTIFRPVRDAQGRVADFIWVYENATIGRLNGTDPKAVVGRRLLELFPGHHGSQFLKAYQQVAETGESCVFEAEYSDDSMTKPTWFRIVVVPMCGDIAVLAQDITERRRAEEQLRAAKDELARANEDLERKVQERTARLQELVNELEHFSYSIVHDMRAPLRSMNSFAAIMTEECAGCLKPTNRDYLRRISNSAKRMDQLITDALHYSRVVRAELRLVPVDIEELLRGMLETYPAFQSPGADIRVEGPLPKVLGNEAYLTQCCSNLLDNAVKFVAPGVTPRVRIWAEEVRNAECGVRSEGENVEHPTLNMEHRSVDSAPSINPQPSTLNSFVRLWFEDNGIGIPEQGRHRLFGMFQRFHSGYEGTGIGLAIVRKVAERLGGKAGVESEPGQGSRFWLELKPAVD